MNLVVYNAGVRSTAAVGGAGGGEHSQARRQQPAVDPIQRIASLPVVIDQSPTRSVTATARTAIVPDGKRNQALFDKQHPIPYSNQLGIRQYEDIQAEANSRSASIFLSAVA